MEAMKDGKVVQYRKKCSDGAWLNFTDRDCINLELCEYRVKPSPRTRPFKSGEECWREMQKHQPLGWVMKKSNSAIVCHLTSLSDCTVYLSHLHGVWGYDEMFPNFTFADGTPFGIKEGGEE